MRIILFACLAVASLALQGHALAIGRLETIEEIENGVETSVEKNVETSVENELISEETDESTTSAPAFLVDDLVTINVIDVQVGDFIKTFLKKRNITEDTVGIKIYADLISSLLKISLRVKNVEDLVFLGSMFDYLYDPTDIRSLISDLKIFETIAIEFYEDYVEAKKIDDEVIVVESLPVPAASPSKDSKTTEDTSGIDLIFDIIDIVSSVPSKSDAASEDSKTNNDIEKTTEPIAEAEKAVETTVEP